MNSVSEIYLRSSFKNTVQDLNRDRTFYFCLKGVSEDERSAIRVSSLSRYGDNCWDFSVEYPNLRPSLVKIRFEQIYFDGGDNITMPGYGQYLYSVKEYCYSLLVDPPASYPKLSTICVALNKGLRNLLRFMRESGIRRFSDIGDVDFSEFQERISSADNKSGGVVTNRTIKSRVYALSWLYEQSGKLSDGLTSSPFGDASSETEWAKEVAQKKLPRKYRTTPEMPDEVAKKLILCALDDLSIADALEEIRFRREEYKRQKRSLKKNLPGDVSKTLAPFSWEEYGISSGHQLKTLESRLSTACYVIIAMLSGMRFHEVAHLKHGRSNNWCVRSVYVDGGVRVFYFLVSKTNKLQHDATQYQWQTVPFVERALDAMERGLALRHERGNSFLFAGSRGERVSLSAINSDLKKYVEYHDIRHEGELWGVSTHQFRKKFARLMIRQGLGLVALQDQLKHFDIEMTKVYGEMDLYAELQREKFILSNEKYDELMRGQVPIIGGGANEVLEYRKMFIGMKAGDRGDFLSSLSRKALIEQVDDGLCMYRAKKALCGGESLNCRPADCNNSIIPAEGMRRTLLWRKRENQRMRSFFKNQPLKVAYIDGRLAEIDKLLHQMDGVQL
ncbi:tyrosine-type recombinase/integrase [Pseudomonas aeruginosa]|uniref:tyrosine-type recombinase/integrase n=1 Tax=Pseudomonas aeruginosa TaxID=287 RepID=UPI000AF49C44|nr:tyrosine-type recombinase/integrase [Pseudomonas aeruginosa]